LAPWRGDCLFQREARGDPAALSGGCPQGDPPLRGQPSGETACGVPPYAGWCLRETVARAKASTTEEPNAGKTARPGLWRGLRATGVPTPEAILGN